MPVDRNEPQQDEPGWARFTDLRSSERAHAVATVDRGAVSACPGVGVTMADPSLPQPSRLRETVAWMLGRRFRVRVVGESMVPTLRAGQFVLVNRGRAPMPGQLVLAQHPEKADLLVVKRLGAMTDDGRFVLTSDNPDAGTDSRSWGPLGPELIEGTVTLLLDQPSAPL